MDEREVMVYGIKFMSVALGILFVNYDDMSLGELRDLLETIEAEYVEKFWFQKYRKRADRKWIEKSNI